MNENITRIADLPDIHSQSQISNNIELGLPNSYIPMNIHPNPYGNNLNQSPPPPAINDFREQSHNIQLSQEHRDMLDNTPHNRLPSRDIQMNTMDYSNDEQVHTNYIPQNNKDYIKDYDDNIQKHRQEKHKIRLIDTIFTEIQIPLIISILFFIFQMSFLNNIFIKFLPFYTYLYNQDGNINIYGMVFKSILFGVFYYFTIESSKFIGEL